MKFKYIGKSRVKNLDLVVFNILKASDIIKPGQIIEVPDSQTELINRMKINGNYVEYHEPKKVVIPKKPKKEEKKEEEKEDK